MKIESQQEVSDKNEQLENIAIPFPVTTAEEMIGFNIVKSLSVDLVKDLDTLLYKIHSLILLLFLRSFINGYAGCILTLKTSTSLFL